MAEKRWAPFPARLGKFNFSGDALKKAWSDLHAGDQEPFPDDRRARALGAKAADAGKLAAALQDAWRAFHEGRFQEAFEAGQSMGPAGVSVAIKAAGIHGTHLLDDDKARASRYQVLIKLAESALATFPEDANAHYRRAFAMGRYSQAVSITKALKEGLAGKVRESLEATLELAPKHAEAHTALGLYHAEIIDKVGAMIGGLTYGAKAATGEKHLAQAVKLTPKAPIVHIEQGNGLLLMYGDKREDDAAEAYEVAARLKPRDAMEALDVAFARSQLEDE